MTATLNKDRATSELTQAEIESAMRVRKKANETIGLVCQLVYQDCPKAPKAAAQWLALVFPEFTARNRYKYLYAGELNSRIAPGGISYGPSVADEARPLMDTDLDWLQSEQRSKSEITNYKYLKEHMPKWLAAETRSKKDLAAAVKAHKAGKSEDNLKPSDKSQEPTSLRSPGDHNHQVRTHNTTIVTDDSIPEGLQPLYTIGRDSGGIPDVQPELGTDGEEHSASVSSMGTSNEREAHRIFDAIQYHIECINKIHDANFLPSECPLTEYQWRELSQEYRELKYFADIRWERLRTEMADDRKEFNKQLDRAIGSSRS